jgi:DNA-binding response OmpR family regulator
MYPDDPNKNGAFSNIVDVYINHIRLKIGKERIATVKRSGYVFD